MIGPTGSVRVMMATRPVDFRKGADGLAALVRETMGADPFSGAVYVFRAKRGDRVKLVFWDGTGVCLFAKRLEDGRFRWPKVEDGVVRLSAAQLSALLEGLDWVRVHETREGRVHWLRRNKVRSILNKTVACCWSVCSTLLRELACIVA